MKNTNFTLAIALLIGITPIAFAKKSCDDLIIVRQADEPAAIQNAVDSACSRGTIVVEAGLYVGAEVRKPVTIIGENAVIEGPCARCFRPDMAFDVWDKADRTGISGFTLNTPRFGIYVFRVDDVDLSDLSIEARRGIVLDTSNGSRVSDSVITGSAIGVLLFNATNSAVIDNHVELSAELTFGVQDDRDGVAVLFGAGHLIKENEIVVVYSGADPGLDCPVAAEFCGPRGIPRDFFTGVFLGHTSDNLVEDNKILASVPGHLRISHITYADFIPGAPLGSGNVITDNTFLGSQKGMNFEGPFTIPENHSVFDNKQD